MKAILISLDTLCASHLGCYGHKFNVSPSIDSFARQGVLFERCYASDVPTPPSYTAIFSGRFGIHNGIFGFQPANTYRSGPPMLQQVIQKAGWETCAVSNVFYPCPWLLPGWKTILPPGLRFQGGKAPDVTDEAISWLKRQAKKDFFLFVHYWEPHAPYSKAPDRHRALFPTRKYRSIAPDMRFINANPIMKSFYARYHEVAEGNPKISSAEVMARYDSQIHYADEEVGRLFDYLDQSGLAEETLVIITSDHGEAFGEYGSFDHFTCYENISHVPLIARLPGKFPEGKRVSGFAYGADLMPTLLELARLEVPDGIDGKSLLPAILDRKPTPHRFVVTDCNALATQRMIVEGKWALAHTISAGPFYHVKPYELFEVPGDSERDLSSENPGKVRELRLKLGDWLAHNLGGGPDPLEQAAFQGGWALDHGGFIWGVLSNLEFAHKNRPLWETLRRKQGSAWDHLRTLKLILEK